MPLLPLDKLNGPHKVSPAGKAQRRKLTILEFMNPRSSEKPGATPTMHSAPKREVAHCHRNWKWKNRKGRVLTHRHYRHSYRNIAHHLVRRSARPQLMHLPVRRPRVLCYLRLRISHDSFVFLRETLGGRMSSRGSLNQDGLSDGLGFITVKTTTVCGAPPAP